MKAIWDIPLDTKEPRHPVLSIIVIRWQPFTYAVTLKALIEGKSREIRRWDKVNKPDHVDIFYQDGTRKKHQRSSIGTIENLDGLERIFIFASENHQRMVEEYLK